MATSSSNHKNLGDNNKNIEDYVLDMDDSSSDLVASSTLSGPSIHDRGEIPDTHRRIADDYMILKKIYGKPVVAISLSQEEQDFLKRYNFTPLEFCSSKQMEEELFLIKKWKVEGAKVVQDISDRIMFIRNKELKNVMSRSYKNSGCLGYKILENYLESISKY